MYVIVPHSRLINDAFKAENLRGVVDNIDTIVESNKICREIVKQRDRGKPGHYWGRDIMLEGAIPEVVFYLTPAEYDNDPTWWKDDKKFQDFMRRHPEYSWLESK
jgi:hypothetical protein